MDHQQPPWVDGLTFAEVLARTVERCGDHDALVFPQLGHRRSYTQFAADVDECARALLALGAQPGEHVGIWATNWPQWVIVQFAAAAAGTVLVNINPAYRSHELAYVLTQADITTLFLTHRFKNSDYFDLLHAVCPELASCGPGELRAEACPKLRRVISIKPDKRPGVLTWDEFRSLAAPVPAEQLRNRQAALGPQDVV